MEKSEYEKEKEKRQLNEGNDLKQANESQADYQRRIQEQRNQGNEQGNQEERQNSTKEQRKNRDPNSQ